MLQKKKKSPNASIERHIRIIGGMFFRIMIVTSVSQTILTERGRKLPLKFAFNWEHRQKHERAYSQLMTSSWDRALLQELTPTKNFPRPAVSCSRFLQVQCCGVARFIIVIDNEVIKYTLFADCLIFLASRSCFRDSSRFVQDSQVSSFHRFKFLGRPSNLQLRTGSRLVSYHTQHK